MKSLTTTSSNQDLPIDLPNTYKYPSSTHIGPAIQRISSRIVLLGQSHFFRSKIYGDDTVLGLISYICYPITKNNMCQHQIITLKSFNYQLVCLLCTLKYTYKSLTYNAPSSPRTLTTPLSLYINPVVLKLLPFQK